MKHANQSINHLLILNKLFTDTSCKIQAYYQSVLKQKSTNTIGCPKAANGMSIFQDTVISNNVMKDFIGNKYASQVIVNERKASKNIQVIPTSDL